MDCLCFFFCLALINLSTWCLMMVEPLFLRVPQSCLRFVIVVFPDHTRLLFLCLLCLCVRLFICALWSSAGKGLPSWLSFVVSICECVTFP